MITMFQSNISISLLSKIVVMDIHSNISKHGSCFHFSGYIYYYHSSFSYFDKYFLLVTYDQSIPVPYIYIYENKLP